MFVYQPTFTTLDLKKDKDTEYIVAQKSKELFKSRLEPLYKAFLPNIKRFGYKIRMQFNKTALVVQDNNYSHKIVDVYIAYDLDYCPRNLLNNSVDSDNKKQ